MFSTCHARRHERTHSQPLIHIRRRPLLQPNFRPSLIWNMWKGGVRTAAAAVVAVMMVRRMEAQNRLRRRFAPPSIHRFGRNCPMKLAPRGSFVEISFRSSREARSLAKELSHQDVFGNGTRSAAAAEIVTVGNRPPIFPRYRCGWEWPALAVLHSTAENEKGRFWSLEASHSGGNHFSLHQDSLIGRHCSSPSIPPGFHGTGRHSEDILWPYRTNTAL